MDARFERYLELLLEWNEKMNLTAITKREEIISKHFEDSLTCLTTGCIGKGASVVDVGTGAGFPGVPIAIERGDVQLTLMDSLNKRVSFLKEVCATVGVQAQCVHIRAEDAGGDARYREQFDVAVSRAVADLPRLAEYCLPLVRPGGVFLAMKGKEVEEEVQRAKPLIERLGGAVREIQLHPLPGTDIVHSIVIIDKQTSTPKRFPRKGKKIGLLDK